MGIWTRIIVLTIGGSLGVNARYWLGVWMTRWVSSHWATCFINVTGSFLIGFLAVLLTHWMPHPNVRLLVITGFLGGYTTFSTFENDAMVLWERGESRQMAANVFVSVAFGFVAVLLGAGLGRALAEPAIPKAAAGSSPARTAMTGPFVPARSLENPSPSTNSDAPEGPGGCQPIHDGEA